MGMSIGELFVSLGFDVDDGKLKDFNEGVKSTAGELLKLSAIATGGVMALGAFVQGSIDRAFGIKNFATETGYAAEGMLRFASAVNQTNTAVSVAEASGAYRKLADHMTEVTDKGGGAVLARLTGGAYHLGMSEDEVIELLRSYKQEFIRQNGGGQIGEAKHAMLLNQVGVGAGAERALDLSSKQYFQLTDDYVRQEMAAAKANTDLGGAIAEANQKWDAFKDSLVADWSSPLIAALKVSQAAFEDFGKDIKAIYDSFMRLPAAIRYTVEIAASLFAVLTAHMGAILALMSGIVAVIVDIGRALRGLPSYTADALKGFKLMWDNPALAANNILAAIDDKIGVDKTDPSLQWFGNMKYGQDANSLMGSLNRKAENSGAQGAPTINQSLTAHINTGANANDVADALRRLQQQAHNDAMLSLAGQGAY